MHYSNMFSFDQEPFGEPMPLLEGSSSQGDIDPVLFSDPYPFLNPATPSMYSLSPTSERSSFLETTRPAPVDSWASTNPLSPPSSNHDLPTAPTSPFVPLTTLSPEMGTVPHPSNYTNDTNLNTNLPPFFSKGSPTSDPTSPTSSASAETDEEAESRVSKARYRPRLNSRSSSSGTTKRCKRQPHNLVERRYREGINSQLEKLRRAIPTLPRSQEEGAVGHSRPSKAIVLAAAIEYINDSVAEREMLTKEIERLRRQVDECKRR